MVGIDGRISRDLSAQFVAQLPGLVLVPLARPFRTVPRLAVDVQPVGLTQPLRVDMAAGVAAGLSEIWQALRNGESAVVQWAIGPPQSRASQPQPFSVTRALGLVAIHEATADERRGWKQKAAEPLLAVRGRIGARAASAELAAPIVRMLGEALRLVGASHAELRIGRVGTRGVRQLDGVKTGGIKWSGILNAAELGSVLGWPVDGVSYQGGNHGRQYPAPSVLLRPVERGHQLSERVLGAGLHPSQRDQVVTLPVESSLHHLHVIGPTGSGKSTLLARLLHADIHAGRSVFVLEPRGDLVEAILAGIPAERRKDVVVIEPGLSGEVVGFNPLAGSTEDAEQRADHLLHLFRELYGSSLGPRSADVLMHALIALARTDKGTLADLPVLLTNAAFRRRTLVSVNDSLVLAPFFSWYDGLSEAERQQVVAPVLNKTRAFLSRTAIRRLLGQASPRFSLDELFQRPRIVLVNLNTGVIGAETAQLIGALLVTELWQAMQRRAMTPATMRRPVMVVVDEVQQYLRLPVDLGDMFAQARGLGVGLTVAHQHMGQLPPKMRAGIIANARSRVVFRPSVEDGAGLAAALGDGLSAGDLALLGTHEAYVRAFIPSVPGRPFLVRTLPPDGQALSDPLDLRRASAERYGVDGLVLDESLRLRWRGEDRPGAEPIGQLPRRRP
ncbi:type IV secretion system DNA-binding domain-containing protein [Streptomyces sp. NPDC051572]|uniref:type IV secretory system conjugative DNA transfer family protein n=1 Tax=Streptomyces sp. NPDC051572 TaxID=3155802 RepID=UPI00344DFF02